MKLLVIVGSVREGRAADKVSAWASKWLTANKSDDVEIEIADLKDINLPFFNYPRHPVMANGDYELPEAKAWAKRVADADAYIIITAEYNHGMPAALKNALDWVAQGWWHKPLTTISYGGISGGTRATQQLRLTALELRMWPVRDAVYIPFIGEAFDDKGTPKREDSLNSQMETAYNSLTEWAAKLKAAR
jgi:NAD(P)H-dependent FMN reductase